MDEHELLCRLLELGVEYPLRTARLAWSRFVRRDCIRPHHRPERKRHEHESQPAQNCCLPVPRTPPPHSGGNVLPVNRVGHTASQPPWARAATTPSVARRPFARGINRRRAMRIGGFADEPQGFSADTWLSTFCGWCEN